MHHRTQAAVMAVAGLLGGQLAAQEPARFDSAKANADHSLTFRYDDPRAAAVVLNMDGAPKPIPMHRGAHGLWTYTTRPLQPEIYSYRFDVDARPQFDPNNLTHITPNLVYRGDQVEVPAAHPQPWDLQAVPHGALHHHTYTTRFVKGLLADQNEYIVWTPAGYDARAKAGYPVLYLLHGWSNTVETWTRTLQADVILDNLLAQGKIKPMVVIMPLGYGDMSFVNGAIGEMWKQPDAVNRNTELFSDALLQEIVPAVEAEYNVSRRREDRAIAGLSMGGLESVQIGLNHTSTFASVGAFSAAVHLLKPEVQLPALDARSANLHLLWIACGTEDGLIDANRKLIATLKADGLPVTAVETPGAHVAPVWRENLIQFAPLLFRER